NLRPAKGIHIVYPHRISNFSISAESIDGRDLLMVAHAGFTLLGTTDDDFYGDLDPVDVQEDEVEYLLQGFERVFPAIRDYRPVRATTGVRPTLFKWRRYEDELSRRYRVIDHASDGADGLISIAGGKLSMYRLMAEETADAVCRKLGHPSRSETANRALPGNESDVVPPGELAARCGIPALAAMKLQSAPGWGARRCWVMPVGRRRSWRRARCGGCSMARADSLVKLAFAYGVHLTRRRLTRGRPQVRALLDTSSADGMRALDRSERERHP